MKPSSKIGLRTRTARLTALCVLLFGGVTAEANIDHDSAFDEFPQSGSALIFGNIEPGKAFGAAWAYEFSLQLTIAFNLRLEGSVSVFEPPIAEPTSLNLTGLLGLAMVARRR